MLITTLTEDSTLHSSELSNLRADACSAIERFSAMTLKGSCCSAISSPTTDRDTGVQACLDCVEQLTGCWWWDASSAGHAQGLPHFQVGAVHPRVQGHEAVLAQTIGGPQLPAAITILNYDCTVAAWVG